MGLGKENKRLLLHEIKSEEWIIGNLEAINGVLGKKFQIWGDGSQIPVWWKWVLSLVWGQIVKDWLHRKSYNDPKIILTCKLSWESLMGRFRKEFLACQGPVQLLWAIFLQNIIFLKKMWFLENTPKNEIRINILSYMNGNEVKKQLSMVICCLLYTSPSPRDGW